MSTKRDPERIVSVAVVQSGRSHWGDGNPGPDANFAVLSDLARQAAAKKPDLIVFPEYAITGKPYLPDDEINNHAEPVPGEGKWYTSYVELAREIRTPLLGNMLEADAQKIYNTALAIDRDGAFVGKYRKVHATIGEQGFWGWSQGEEFCPFELDGVRYGVSICADMWFPETVLCNSLLGTDIHLHQSVGDDMMHIVPTRALDSAVPIVMSIYSGGAYAVDPKGKLLGKLPSSTPGYMVFEFKPFEVRLDERYEGLWIEKLARRNMRNPWAYGILTDCSTRPDWTEVFRDEQGRPVPKDLLLERFHGNWDDKDPASSQGRA